VNRPNSVKTKPEKTWCYRRKLCGEGSRGVLTDRKIIVKGKGHQTWEFTTVIPATQEKEAEGL
jgi:hypothetical protein